jgi:anaerobic selenocysteine-containing dehydrogenase
MEAVSRRGFLKQAGAAAVVAVAGTSLATTPAGVAGALASRPAAHELALTPEETLKSGEDLVAQVVDAKTGEISLFIGQRQVTLHDKTVAARLVRATR